jgi:ABC-type amino acid transport substrate-binding protein
MMHVPVDKGLMEDNDKVAIFGAYYRAKLGVLYDPAQVSAINALTALDNLKVGVETDQLADHYLTAAYGGRYRDNVVHFMLPEQAAEALRNKEIQAFMGPVSHIQGALGTAAKDYGVSFPPLRGLAVDGWDVGVAVKEDHGELAKRVADAVAALLADGTIEKIFAAHNVTWRAPGSS